MSGHPVVARAGPGDLGPLAALFDQYRQFYGLGSDIRACRTYLGERMEHVDSIVFLARGTAGEAVGFTQVYPSYCSLAARPIWILYDLFVAPGARRQGVGEMLMKHAAQAARDDGAARIRLETHKDNAAAQTLYRSLGYRRDEEFHVFELDLGAS